MKSSRSLSLEICKIETKRVEAARWPLGYRLQVPGADNRSLQRNGFSLSHTPTRKWWSHKLYRGPNQEEVEILYSKTKAQSEIIARQFRDEPILGFDMEWPWNDSNRNDLQNKVGLIQIASETKIGLFHIGLHPGKTTDDIIAPTLRTIIESPTIGKVGVNILQADFGRLSRYFGLKPKGAIESSHLYRLVKFGPHRPQYVSIKGVSLAKQVEDYLCYPLYKGDVRTSNWSKPLSQEQINYAAGDAYAGFMLYHCMNAKRLAMKPTPPLPIYAEKDERKRFMDNPILLDAGDGTFITSEAFFGVKPVITALHKSTTEAGKHAGSSKAATPALVLDPSSQALYNDLLAALHKNTENSPARVLPDSVLMSIAKERPTETKSLLLIQGFGKVYLQKYGSAILQVISSFISQNGSAQPTNILSRSSTAAIIKPQGQATKELPKSSSCLKIAHNTSLDDPSFSATAVAPPRSPLLPSPPPQLSTGCSFALAETKIDAERIAHVQSYDSDLSLPSLDFGSASPRSKRRRTTSPDRRRFSADTNSTKQPADLCGGNHSGASPPKKDTAQVSSPYRAAGASSNKEPPLTPRSRILQSKLLAFSKLVASKLPARPANVPPFVTAETLELLARTAPQTQDQLEKIAGIDGFLAACKQTNRDLLSNVIKFAAAPT